MTRHERLLGAPQFCRYPIHGTRAMGCTALGPGSRSRSAMPTLYICHDRQQAASLLPQVAPLRAQ